jgi:hypothetical protein
VNQRLSVPIGVETPRRITGVVLPSDGVTYYDVPAEYHVGPGYRYTYVNDHPVIVEARTGRIVEILD